MNRAAGPESEETSAEARRPDPHETSAIPAGQGDVATGETVQFASRPRAAVELPTIPEGHYDRENEIARGGMGRIVAAWDLRLGRPVAIKELLHSTPDLRRRFEREAVMTARLQHPAIINVYEAGRWPGGEPFYAMKRVDGRSLADAIQAAPSFNQRLALLPSLITIAEAMAYAHGQRVIHRDLKPANVLLGSFGESVVIDWGLAKDLTVVPGATEDDLSPLEAGDGLTVSGTVMGTPAYMPPEQARGATLDERADVYALGAILYHLLAGQAPYSGQNSAEVLKQVLATAPRPLDEREPGVAPDLLAVVRKAMARDVTLRYRTAKELAEDLRRFQTGQLVGAHSYSPRELAQRWLARHRAPASIAAIAGLVLVTTGILGVQRIARERNEAQAARREADVRNDELILNQARNALRDDPTSAIAWLKNYSLDGPAWGAARMIAADARSQGVATRVLAGHEHSVNRVAFSPDGRLVASAGADRTVRLWEVATGTSRILSGHDWFVYTLEFSPDGKWLASAGGQMLALWNVATGEGRFARARFLDKDIAFSPDGQALAALATDDEGLYIQLWDPQTGFTRILRDRTDKLLHSRLRGDASLAFAPDGATLVAWTGDDTLRAWDMKTGRSLKTPNRRGLALSLDGRLLASANTANVIVVRDLVSGKERVLAGGSGEVTTVAFSPDRQWVAAASEDSLVRLWNVTTGNLRSLEGHSGAVGGVLFSPDSRTLASFGDDRSLRLWDVATGDTQALRGHAEPIRGIAFSPDGRVVASAGRDRTIRLWPTTTNDHRVLSRPGMSRGSFSRRIAFGPTGHLVAATWDGESIQVFDLDRGVNRVLGEQSATGGRGEPFENLRMVFSPDGKALAFSRFDKNVLVWDVTTGEVRTFSGHEGRVTSLAFSPDGSRMASVSHDTMVRIWDMAAGTSLVLSGHQFPLAHVAFSPDGRSLASSSMGMKRDAGQLDLTVRIWNAPAWKAQELMGHDDTVTDVQFFRDGRTIASGSMDATVRLWDAATGRLQRVLKGDGSIVNEVSLSRDGRWLASGNDGGLTRLWNLATGESRLLKGRAPVFSEDGATLATPGSDGVARLWDTATGEGRVLRDVHSNVAISPDGTLAAGIGKGGAIHLWNDDLPRDPAALKAWFHKVTEHSVGAGRDR